MDVDEAKDILSQCDRHELRDHAFGDMEVTWTIPGRSHEVAYGYSSGRSYGVHMVGDSTFDAEEAKMLLACGDLVQVERNDEAGPEDFVEGRIMPGLTKQAVRQELIKQAMLRNRKSSDLNDYRRYRSE